ncbi:hypothetical protein U1Q18_046567 [Sarracenia purpurea var. burkii]
MAAAWWMAATVLALSCLLFCFVGWVGCCCCVGSADVNISDVMWHGWVLVMVVAKVLCHGCCCCYGYVLLGCYGLLLEFAAIVGLLLLELAALCWAGGWLPLSWLVAGFPLVLAAVMLCSSCYGLAKGRGLFENYMPMELLGLTKPTLALHKCQMPNANSQNIVLLSWICCSSWNYLAWSDDIAGQEVHMVKHCLAWLSRCHDIAAIDAGHGSGAIAAIICFQPNLVN